MKNGINLIRQDVPSAVISLSQRTMAALIVLVLAAAMCAPAARAQLVIEDVQRRIDLTSFRAGFQTKLTVRNGGQTAAESVLLCFPNGLLDHAAVIETGDGGTKLKWAVALPPADAPAGVGCRAFQLAAPLGPGAKVSLQSEGLFTHVLQPKPAKIKQNEPQRVVYQDSAVLVSPYAVEQQSTEIVLGTSNTASFTAVPPSKQSGSVVQYGPYQSTAPFTLQPISVLYENSSPFAHVPELEREIEISHWGQVYFEERYTLRHAGAQVVGEWSRYDVMTKPAEFARAAILGLSATLPPTAHSLYYRDAIGNISSSEARFGADQVSVQLQPRYPLFGGWLVKFLFGWSLPLQNCVTKMPTGRMAFVAPLGPAVHGLVVDQLTVRVVLPEGARGAKVEVGLPLEVPPEQGLKYTYLDVMGRPVVVLRISNYVDELNLPLKVEYTYSSLGLLQKPLLLVAVFGAIFAAAIALNRSGAALKGSPSTQAVGKQHAS